MIGVLFVFLLVVAIVGGYIAIVNQMLRSDEHWNESYQAQPAAKTARPVFCQSVASHAHA